MKHGSNTNFGKGCLVVRVSSVFHPWLKNDARPFRFDRRTG